MRKIRDIREILFSNNHLVSDIYIKHNDSFSVLYSSKKIKINSYRYEKLKELIENEKLYKI